MKNLLNKFLIVAMLLVFTFPFAVHADGGVTVINTQDRTALESQLNVIQKELIVLLNKRVDMLRAEFVANTEMKIRSLQFQLVGLLQEQITLLRVQVNNQS